MSVELLGARLPHSRMPGLGRLLKVMLPHLPSKPFLDEACKREQEILCVQKIGS